MTVPKQVLSWTDPARATLSRLGYKDINVNLVLALLWKESSGNPWACRYEHGYRYLWDVKKDAPVRQLSDAEQWAAVPPVDFPCYAGNQHQEWTMQHCSLGLLQIMGAAAREQGFRGNFLTELCDPYVNLEYGLKHLWCYAFQKGNWTTAKALSRWNGGGDTSYADDVLNKRTLIEQQERVI